MVRSKKFTNSKSFTVYGSDGNKGFEKVLLGKKGASCLGETLRTSLEIAGNLVV